VLIKINENTNQIYILVNDTSVTNSATNKSFLAIVDGQTNTLLNKIKLNNETRNFEINMLTNKIYITKRNGEISVVNGNTGNIVTTINTDKNPRNIVVNNKTNRIYVINPNKGLINVINGKTDVLLTKIRVAGRPVTILVNENTNQIYVPENREVIAFIDGDTNQIVDRIKVGGNIVHLSLNKVTNNIYAIDNNNPIGKAIVINAIKKNIVSTFKLGVSPSKAEVNEITNKAYITNWLSDTLSEIILPNN
jgi:DNA-binding beta-propeller fold protein YncE